MPLLAATTPGPLAAAADVEAVIGRTLTAAENARVDHFLAQASARVRRECTGVAFTQATGTLKLRVRDGRIRLPLRPVLAVTAVRGICPDGTVIDLPGWQWITGTLVEWIWPNEAYLPPRFPYPWQGGALDWAEVDCTVGYDQVPAEITGLVAELVARVLPHSAGVAGLRNQSVGPYTAGYTATAGQIALTDEDKAILALYRQPPRPRPVNL